MDALCRLIEALLLAAEHPLTSTAVVELINAAVDEEEWPARVDLAQVEAAFVALAGGVSRFGGIERAEVGGGYRLRTAADLAPMVRRLWPDRPSRLSGAALEVLAIVAYRQPCTKTDVEEIRGVDCGGVMRSLLERRLIRIVGKKDELGRPLLYGTTVEFLETFSLPDLRALPTLRELEALQVEEAARDKGDRILEAAVSAGEQLTLEPEVAQADPVASETESVPDSPPDSEP
ncbi:MAG: SMC-Scp complex subunit ScpB [Myxococcales bacterium]|nr:SMC-Scp complex subunit ScpB [Myxococcales bacterium]